MRITDALYRNLDHARRCLKTGPDRAAHYDSEAGPRGIVKAGGHLFYSDHFVVSASEVLDAARERFPELFNGREA